MPYPASIDSLAKGSDLVAKVKVLSVEPVVWDRSPLANKFWKVCRAKLKYISVLKGAPESAVSDFLFRSDTPCDKGQAMWIDVGPENYPHYRLKPGHSYILFMSKNGKSELMQVSVRFGLRAWEGFFRAADDSALAPGINVRQAIWNELTKALKSKDAESEKDAVLTLLNLSNNNRGSSCGSDDFARALVISTIFAGEKTPLAACRKPEVLKEILESLGSGSPYCNQSVRMRYLWSKATKPISSWAPWVSPANIAIRPAIPFLIGIADDEKDPKTRAAAILSLGNCQSDSQSAKAIGAKLDSWLVSPCAEVRAAAVYLVADYPKSSKWQSRLLLDSAALVREAAAYSCGITHSEQAISQLAAMLKDPCAEVQASAALSLMAYPVEKVKTVLTANLNNPDYADAFVARLATASPASMRDRLLTVCKKKDPMLSPGNLTTQAIAFQNGLGTSPHYVCISSLMSYLDGLSGAELGKSEYTKYLDAIEAIGVVDPAHTGKVYEILASHNLTDKANAFKKKAQSAQPSIPSIAFEQVERDLASGTLKFK